MFLIAENTAIGYRIRALPCGQIQLTCSCRNVAQRCFLRWMRNSVIYDESNPPDKQSHPLELIKGW